jgi:nucleotide-binding universal stress UspA family protein
VPATDRPPTDTDPSSPEAAHLGPVLLAYDGSDLAAQAIEEASQHLAGGRDALVVCVWQPADVGFIPVDKRHFNADEAMEVQLAAAETAAHGASLAEGLGFRARSVAVESAPTWKGIVSTAEQHHASVIVVGSHRHSGLVGHLLGNVAAAVVAHSTSPVFVVHQRH